MTQVYEPTKDVERQPSRKEQVLEVLVYIFLILPSMAFSLIEKGIEDVSFPFVAATTIVRDIALVSLIGFFLWRNRESVRRIGWKAKKLWLEVLIGLALYVPFFYGSALVDEFYRWLGLSEPAQSGSFLVPQGAWQHLLAVVLVTVVAISEETIFRGYLILRLGAATRSLTLAVIISSVIFAIGHGYEGTAGMATVGTMGAAFALVYLWRKSLVAPMVMHFLQDFIGIVLASYLLK